MTTCLLKRPLTCLVITILVAGATVSPAYAQYRPLPAPGSGAASQKGEKYHFEVSFNLWNPVPSFVVASDGLGIGGTTIDAQADLGIQQRQINDFRIVFKPAARHKFRFSYLPMDYISTVTLNATIYFNGRQYPVSAEVGSDLKWKTYRIGYEYDFVSNKAGFFGMILEAKETTAEIQLTSVVGNELAKAQAPIPAIGFIGRVYPATGFSVTGEYTIFKLPGNVFKDIDAHYTEFDIYATYNFTNNFGAQAGYRRIDVWVTVTNVHGSALLSGPYFGGVARF